MKWIMQQQNNPVRSIPHYYSSRNYNNREAQHNTTKKTTSPLMWNYRSTRERVVAGSPIGKEAPARRPPHLYRFTGIIRGWSTVGTRGKNETPSKCSCHICALRCACTNLHRSVLITLSNQLPVEIHHGFAHTRLFESRVVVDRHIKEKS